MYIRREKRGNQHYLLCESYWGEGCWKHRVLLDLGPDPGEHIEYPGGNSFYVKEYVEDQLASLGAHYSLDEIERVFVPFLRPEIRRVYEMFDRSEAPKKWKQLTKEQLFERQKSLHFFDKRRIHYLRCGRVDIGTLDARPWGFLNPLLDKSRDEIENLMEEMEKALPPHEVRPYLYTSLYMQKHFDHLLTKNHPSALDPEKVDKFFVEDICLLNKDMHFFEGVEDHDPSVLHPYLVRYVVMYFDTSWDQMHFWQDPVEGFIGTHRFYRKGNYSSKFSSDEKKACEKLGIKMDQLGKMDKAELSRIYRLKAKESHPDAGGSGEAFLEIKEAYECLLRRIH